MANVLDKREQVAIFSGLPESSGIQLLEHVASVHLAPA